MYDLDFNFPLNFFDQSIRTLNCYYSERTVNKGTSMILAKQYVKKEYGKLELVKSIWYTELRVLEYYKSLNL
jgi:hypothetical protein